MKQYEIVMEAMRREGGFATLGRLYRTVPELPGGQWGTKTPFASIRRIVQTHPEHFFRIRPGLWGLVERAEEIKRALGWASAPKSREQDEMGHTYYQGLVVEIGNLRGLKTAVAPQDRNKVFVNRSLASLVTLSDMPKFTYEHIVRRARTIDVTWMNERELPHSFFEIEHSTDIYNSLLKFVDLQDFRAKLFIVADINRRAEFQTKVSYTAFEPIRQTVKFLDYDSLSQLHTRVTETALLNEQCGL